MFTGLVQTVGSVARIEKRGVDATLRIACSFEGYEHGESIAVDGCCLSVVESGPGWFAAEASAETLRLTVLGDRASGDPVHLERAMRPDQRLGARGPGTRVNLEVDVLAKYVARLLGRPGVDGVPPGETTGVTMDLLRKAGYL